jgi:DNA-directed RNA polymerase subunit RPC12/RpoP
MALQEKSSVGLMVNICPNCGANLETDINENESVCGYCGSNIVIKSKLDSGLNADELFAAAVKEAQSGNPQQALEWLYKTIEIDPDRANAYMLIGSCLVFGTPSHQIDADKVISYYQQAQAKFLQENPTSEQMLTFYKSVANNFNVCCQNITERARNDSNENKIEYKSYWEAINNAMDLRYYIVNLFDENPLIVKDFTATETFNSFCSIIINICNSYEQILAEDGENGLPDYRNRCQDIKKDMQKKIEQNKALHDRFRREALLAEKEELNNIINANRSKIIGEGAKARKAAEIKLKEVLGDLEKLNG